MSTRRGWAGCFFLGYRSFIQTGFSLWVHWDQGFQTEEAKFDFIKYFPSYSTFKQKRTRLSVWTIVDLLLNSFDLPVSHIFNCYYHFNFDFSRHTGRYTILFFRYFWYADFKNPHHVFISSVQNAGSPCSCCWFCWF